MRVVFAVPKCMYCCLYHSVAVIQIKTEIIILSKPITSQNTGNLINVYNSIIKKIASLSLHLEGNFIVQDKNLEVRSSDSEPNNFFLIL